MEKTKVYAQRLAKWRKSAKLSQRALGAAMGLSHGYISNIESGLSDPSRNFMQALSSTFGVNPAWILDGREPMVFDALPGAAGRTGPVLPPLSHDGIDYVFVPQKALSLSAGSGLVPIEGDDAGGLAFARATLQRLGVNADLAVLVSVRGGSMAPTIPDGALILVHLAEQQVTAPGIFAFSLGSEVLVKRLLPLAFDAAGHATSLVIHSDNPAYPPRSVVLDEASQFRIAGRVRAVLTTF